MQVRRLIVRSANSAPSPFRFDLRCLSSRNGAGRLGQLSGEDFLGFSDSTGFKHSKPLRAVQMSVPEEAKRQSDKWTKASKVKKVTPGGEEQAEARKLLLEHREALRERRTATQRNSKRQDYRKVTFRPIEVALVGRPNCGKSSIWNRLVSPEKNRRAIVSSVAGTTRDRRSGEAKLGELKFTLIDTGGLEELDDVGRSTMRQTEVAVGEADVILFCIDAQVGVTYQDEAYAAWLRKRALPKKLDNRGEVKSQSRVVLIANKTEGISRDEERMEAFAKDCRRLGFGEPVLFSAMQSEGLGDLYAALEPLALTSERFGPDPVEAKADETPLAVSEPVATENATPVARVVPLRMTILGRPNAGKSSLLNALIGKNRVMTGSTPGLTRDAISVEWQYENRPIVLVDTAGMRSKGTLYTASKQLLDKDDGSQEHIERAAVAKSLQALAEAHVAILVVDLQETGTGSGGSRESSIAQQDLAIAGRVVDEGRALIIVGNKVDRVRVMPGYEEMTKAEKERWTENDGSQEIDLSRTLTEADEARMSEWLSSEFSKSISQLKNVPCVVLSSTEKPEEISKKLMPIVIDAEARWNSRIPTHKLMKWVQETTTQHPPPAISLISEDKKDSKSKKSFAAKSKAFVRIKYATQVSTRPPTFALWVNRRNPERALPESYQRFLINRIREDFKLEGVPLRIMLRCSENPFVNKADQSSSALGEWSNSEQDRGPRQELHLLSSSTSKN